MKFLRIAAAWLLLCGQAGAVPASVQPPVAYNTPGGVPQLGATSQIVPDNLPRPVPIQTRAQFGGAVPPPALTAALRTSSGLTSRLLEQTPTSGGAIYAVRLVFSGYYSNTCTVPGVTNGDCEQAAPDTVTYQAALEVGTAGGATTWSNGAVTPGPLFALNGNTSIAVPPGSTVKTDWQYVYLPPGTPYYVRTYGIDAAGTIPIRQIAHAANIEGSNTGQSGGLTLGTGNGSATTFTYTVSGSYLPVASGSVAITIPGFSYYIVPSSGTGTDTCVANTNGIASCSVNDTTGAISITTMAAVANGSNIIGSLVGGTAGGNQTQTAALVPFNSATINIAQNPMIGPVAIEALQVSGSAPRLRSICAVGDSINQGVGNVATGSVLLTDTSWINYSSGGRFGITKTAISGEQLGVWASPGGHYGRSAFMAGCDRIIDNEGTNELPNGKSVSQLINYQMSALPALAGGLPHAAADLWWVSMLPRQAAGGSGFFAIGSGPYAAAGAGYGPGAVVNPTPLGGGYASGVLGNAIQQCTITGNGTTGPYSCAFSGATMPGSLWSDGSVTTVIDTGSGGTSATTLTGSGVSTGTHTPSTGATSLTLTSALATGSTVKLYAFLTGPSARNAWNYYLYNYALPKGLIGGMIDTAACIELSPATAMGAGTGQWASSSLTYDYTHPSNLAHSVTLPGCIGPSGTTPSAAWSFPP